MEETEYLAYHSVLNISKQRDWLLSWYWCLFDILLLHRRAFRVICATKFDSLGRASVRKHSRQV